jgi:hypothetical protein
MAELQNGRTGHSATRTYIHPKTGQPTARTYQTSAPTTGLQTDFTAITPPSV